MTFKYEEREYQTRLVNSTVGHFTNIDPKYDRELSRVLLLSPCGSGKTVTSFRIIEELYQKGYRKVAFIAHRNKLLDQANEHLIKMDVLNKCPDLQFRTLGIFEKDFQDMVGCDLVIFDEAHHSVCDSGIYLVEHLKPKKILGLTATNWRTDRIKLVFEKICTDYGINSLIEMGYLAKFDHYLIDDWSAETVVKTYLKDIEKFGKTVMYFHTEEESERAFSLLKNAGVAVGSIYSHHNRRQREELYDSFEDGRIKVVCNVLLLTEGADFPDLQTVFVKPSIKGLTIQMGGRALRLAPGKTFANIVQMKGHGHSFLRVAKARDSFVYNDGRWKQTQFSQEFLNNIGTSTLKYKLSLAQDVSNFEKMEIPVVDKKSKLDFDSISNPNHLRSSEDLDDVSIL